MDDTRLIVCRPSSVPTTRITGGHHVGRKNGDGACKTHRRAERWPDTAVIMTGDARPAASPRGEPLGTSAGGVQRRPLSNALGLTRPPGDDDEADLATVPRVRKPLTREQLAEAIRAVASAQGDPRRSATPQQAREAGPQRLEWHDLVLDSERHVATLAGDPLDLTPSQ